MKWHNIIYINGSTVTVKTKKRVIYKQISKDILYNGKILSKNKFYKEFISIYKDNSISTLFILKNIIVVTSDNSSDEIIKSLFYDVNINNILIINDEDLINEDNYIIINGNIIKIYFTNKYKENKKINLNIKDYSLMEIKYLLLNRLKHKETYVINTNKYIENILKSIKIKYYIYNNDNFLIDLVSDKYALN